MTLQVSECKKGSCYLCMKKKEQPVFLVRSPAYSGFMCAKHMQCILQTHPNEPSPLFDSVPEK